MIEGLRYKLRMLGVPLDGPTNIFGNNQLVISNATIPESPIKKKHLSFYYHCIREACAAGVIRIAKESTDTDLADLLTKNLDKQSHKSLVERTLRFSYFQSNKTSCGWNKWTFCTYETLCILELWLVSRFHRT